MPIVDFLDQLPDNRRLEVSQFLTASTRAVATTDELLDRLHVALALKLRGKGQPN